MTKFPLKPDIQYHLWEVWHGEHGEIRGRIIEEWRVAKLKSRYDYYHEIKGRAHIYYIVSHEPITREEAIWFAKEEYAGKLRRLQINLEGLGR